ncbi:hypothetical protein ABZ934_32310 [Streptomyces sp. NPDC046557]|uniref:hypothetical protein n=1 Tax=Streptomyces sp. NPDC046557 TaxID=3155372 RepID=UPI0033FCE8C3
MTFTHAAAPYAVTIQPDGWFELADWTPTASAAADALNCRLACPVAVSAQLTMWVDEVVRVAERFRSGSGGLRVTFTWPAGLRGAASVGSVGVERHGVAYVGPGGGVRVRAAWLRRSRPGGLVSGARERGRAGDGVALRRRNPLHGVEAAAYGRQDGGRPLQLSDERS